MKHLHFYILPLLVALFTFSAAMASSVKQQPSTAQAATTTAADSDTLVPANVPPDTARFKMHKVDLDNVVNFQSTDSMVMLGKNKAVMYGSGEISYGDITLQAERISMDMDSSQVHAIGIPDSTGEVQGQPKYTDSSGEYDSKVMNYNFKTKKGFITDIATQQGEGYLTGGLAKKMEDNEFYMQNGRYTTCDNKEHPHFYLQLTKAKVIPKKNVVTGPAYMVLEDLPLPIAVPFGYFPFSSKYHSGILMPTLGEDYNRGFYLRNGGYYFAINDYVDLALTGEIYTRGSWGLTAQSSYNKRYKYRGNVNISYLTTITGDKGDPDYTKMKNFRIQWSHSQNAKANPNMTFSASVNFATSGYSRNNLDDYYSQSFTENTKSSTVNMTYKFPGTKWSLSTTASVSQRTSDSTVSVSFPNFTLTMAQLAPFKRKRAVGDEKWYEKIKISYTGRFQNSLTAKQKGFFKNSLIKDWRNGMSHSVPISATFNVLKYFNVTPSISLNDRMYSSKVRQQWDPNASAVVLDTTYNFYNVFDFNAAMSFNTKIYGFFKPMKFLGDKLQMVRHVFTPTITFSAAPDFSSPFWGYYGRLDYTDANGVAHHSKYSYFSNGVFGNASSGKTGMVSFSFANNLEAKVKSDKDSTGYKKISLIENLTLNQSYNFAADSLRWSNLTTSMMLRITRGFNLNLNATWDVYKYGINEAGYPVRINKLRLTHGGGWGKLASTGTSFSYTFNNDTFRRKKKKNATMPQPESNEELSPEEQQAELEASKNGDDEQQDYVLNPDGYMKWQVPWNLTVNYSLSYGYGTFNKRKMEYNGRFTHNLSFSGNIKPTKNWNFSFTSSYNFETGKIAYMNCSVSREMHCFTMSASFVPVGPYKSYNFHIAVKSSILSDLKYDKRSSYSNDITWY